MKVNGIGGYKNIDDFVSKKLDRFEKSPKDFSVFFELMFSEKENIMWEESKGYRIVKKTYGEVYDLILRKATTLSVVLRDFSVGSVVGLRMENSLAWIEMFWAIILCGFNPLLINSRLEEKHIESAVSSCGCVYVVDSDVEPADDVYVPSDFGTEILVMSSGTSDSVKLCAYGAEEFYYQICDSFNIIQESALMKKHYKGELKQLCFLPFCHIFGLVAVYIWFAFFSRTFVQLNDLNPSTILNTIKRQKVTHIFAVPLFWETVYNSTVKEVKSRGEKMYKKFVKGIKLGDKFGGLFTRFALKSVRDELFGDSICFMISGGSSISPEILKFFNAIGYHLADGYGMSEIGITSVELSTKKKYLNSCCVGKPLSHVEYSINDSGELLVRGKTTARYIIENGKKTYRDSWFNTHDLAEVWNGHYRIMGRADDVVIGPDGENLNPNLVEPQFMMAGVNDICLIKGPVLLVFVDKYLTNDGFAVLSSRVKEKVMPNVRVVFVKSPLLAGNEFKKNRRRLYADYTAGNLKLFDVNNSNDGDMDELMADIFSRFCVAVDMPAERVSVSDDYFTDCGGTSLSYLGLITNLEEDFGVKIVLSDNRKLRSVKDFYDYIKETREKIV